MNGELMANLTEEQKQKLVQSGLDPLTFEKFNQAKADAIISRLGPAAPVTKQPAPVATKPPAPKTKPAPAATVQKKAPVISGLDPRELSIPVGELDPRELAIPSEDELEEIKLGGGPLEALGQPSAYDPANVSPRLPGAPITAPGAPGIDSATPAQSALFSGLEKERDAIGTGTTVTKVVTGGGIKEAEREFVKSRSTDPLGKTEAAREADAKRKAEEVVDSYFTPGGERRPLTASFASKRDEANKGSIGAAYLPQVIATPEEAIAAKEIELSASKDAILTLNKEYEKVLRQAASAKDDKLTEDIQKRITLLKEKPASSPDFITRKSELIEYENLRRRAAAEGKVLPQFEADIFDKSIFEKSAAIGGELLKQAFTSADPGGAIVETPLQVGLRFLASPVSAGVGVLEAGFGAIGTPGVKVKPLDEAVADRIRGGLSAMGGGLDIAEAAIEASGLPKDSPYATTARIAGGGAGLIIDFLLPVVPGFGAATSSFKAASQTLAIEKALGSTSSVAKTAGLNAAKAAAGEIGRAIPFASRYVAPEYGLDVFSQSLTRYGKNGDNIETMKDLVNIAEDVDLKKLSDADEAARLIILEQAWKTKVQPQRGGTFNDWLLKTSKVSDATDPAIYGFIKSEMPNAQKRALLSDALNNDAKAALARGTALSSEELMKDLISFAISKDIDVSKLKLKLPNGQANVPDILEAIANKTIPTVLSKETPVLEQLLYSYANTNVTKGLTSTKAGAAALPRYQRLTRTSFIPADQTAAVTKQFENTIGSIRDKVVKAIAEGRPTANLSPEEVSMIMDLTLPTSLRFLPDDLKNNLKDLVDEIIKPTAVSDRPYGNTGYGGGLAQQTVGMQKEATLTGAKINVAQYNSLSEKILDQIASSKPGYKSIFDVEQDLRNIPEGAGFSKEAYYQKVLTPKEVAGGTLESTLKTGVNRLADEGEASSSVLSKEFIDEISQRWGSIPEAFKAKYRQARAEGLSAPDAWSKVMVENYLIEGADEARKAILVGAEPIENLSTLRGGASDLADPVVRARFKKEAEALRADAFARADSIKDQNLNQMFDDYLSMIYGGFESVIESYSTAAGVRHIDGMLVASGEMKKLAYVLAQHPYLKAQRATFLSLAKQGKHGEALVKLRDVHAIVQGRGINQFIKNAEELEVLFEAARKADANNLLGGIPYKTDGFRQGERGIFEIWNYGKEAAPMFLVDDHLDLLSAQYLTRRQAGVVADVYADYAKVMPDLFPTAEGIANNVDNFRSNFGFYLAEDASGFVRSVKAGLGNKSLSTTASNFPIDVEVVVKQLLNKALDGDTARKMYVALIEDSLTSLSSSQAAANRFRTVVTSSFKETKASAVLEQVDELRTAISNNTRTPIADVKITKAEIREIEKAVDEIFEQTFFGAGKQYFKSFSGSSDYIRSIYPKLRAETTPLFFDTLKSSIRQAARSNIEVITTGPLAIVDTIPLTFQETAAAKRALQKKGGVEDLAKSMEQLAISSTVRKLDNPELAQTAAAALEAGLEATLTLRQGAKASAQKRFFNWIGQVAGTPSSLFSDGRIASVAKSGMLGGYSLVPNPKYLVGNLMTAPAIVYSTLGSEFLAYSKGSISSIDALTGGGIRGLIDIRVNPTPTKVEVVVTSPTGKVYTNYDIADIVSQNSIARSQASAELTNQVLQDISSFSAVEAGKLTGKIPAGLKGISRDQIIQALKENVGFGFTSRSMNIYQELAGQTDTAFRTNVLIKALKEGRSEAEAIKLARESLFDYGNLSRIERDYINKAFWFWTFRRNSYRAVLKSLLTNPQRLKNTYLANEFLPEVDRQYNISTRDYANTRPFLGLIEDKENLQRFGLYGAANPMLDSTSQMLDHIAILTPLLNPSLTVGEKLGQVADKAIMEIGAMSSPLLQTIIGYSFGVDVRREGKELGYGLDPKLMAWFQLSPEAWETFQVFVNVEAVPPLEEIPGKGTYQGKQWRIRKGDKTSVRNWYLIQQCVVAAGLYRNFRDWSPILPQETFNVMPDGSKVPRITDPSLGGSREGIEKDLIRFFEIAGVITPISQPSLQDQIEFNKKALYFKLKEGTYK